MCGSFLDPSLNKSTVKSCYWGPGGNLNVDWISDDCGGLYCVILAKLELDYPRSLSRSSSGLEEAKRGILTRLGRWKEAGVTLQGFDEARQTDTEGSVDSSLSSSSSVPTQHFSPTINSASQQQPWAQPQMLGCGPLWPKQLLLRGFVNCVRLIMVLHLA